MSLIEFIANWGPMFIILGILISFLLGNLLMSIFFRMIIQESGTLKIGLLTTMFRITTIPMIASLGLQMALTKLGTEFAGTSGIVSLLALLLSPVFGYIVFYITLKKRLNNYVSENKIPTI